MQTRIPGLLGMSGFNGGVNQIYQSAANVGAGAVAGFSVIVAVKPQRDNVDDPELIFGSTTTGLDGWSIQRETDTASGDRTLTTYSVVCNSEVHELTLYGAARNDRFLTIGFTLSGTDLYVYINGQLWFLDDTSGVTPVVGAFLKLGGVNGLANFANSQDTIMAAMYVEDALSNANHEAFVDSYRTFGSFRALAPQFNAELCYDFVGAQPAFPAPALVNSGTLGAAGNLTYQGTTVLVPRVVQNELADPVFIAT